MTSPRWRLSAVVLFAGYAATIGGANWATTHWSVVTVVDLQIPPGALVAGLTFTVRDFLQDAVGTRATLLAIALGAALSGLAIEPRIALASAAAFVGSELVDFVVYTPLRLRNQLAAVGLSNVAGLVVDSLLFLPLALGSLTYLAGHLVGKVVTTLLAVAVLACAHRRSVSS